MEDRAALVRRGLRLNYLTFAYNAVEAVVALAAGSAAESIALFGFGIDSLIELTASAAAFLRLRADLEHEARERVEARTRRVIGACFLALAAYVAYDATATLWRHEPPRESPLGIVLAAVSLLVMPLLAAAKRKVALAMNSGALLSESKQTSLCAYLSALLLGGLVLNATLGWWWADPVAALAMVPIIAREGVEGIRGRSACDDG